MSSHFFEGFLKILIFITITSSFTAVKLQRSFWHMPCLAYGVQKNIGCILTSSPKYLSSSTHGKCRTTNTFHEKHVWFVCELDGIGVVTEVRMHVCAKQNVLEEKNSG